MTKFIYPILTAEQQYNNLVQKGIKFDISKEDVIKFFTHHSYFKVMLYFRPYRFVNEQGGRTFNEGTLWSSILQDFYFDHDLRILLFSYIIHIENSFKNILCQTTCQKLGNIRWTDVANFANTSVFVESIQPIISEILLGESKSEYIQKYIEQNNEPKFPPFRNMIEVFTLGQVAKMYRSLTDGDIKKAISSQYSLNEDKLQNYMKIIVDVRNACCHHNKLFDKTSRKITHVKNIEDMVDKKYETLYHLNCLIYYLLSYIDTKKSNSFKNEMKTLLSKYPTINNGFPANRESLWK